jgi:hypothetical protein
MKTIHEVSTELHMEISDLGSLISNGRIARPTRANNQWLFSEDNIKEIRSIAPDLLPSYQRLFRQKAFWAHKVDGVTIHPTVIALARAACENSTLFENNKTILVRDYPDQFVAYARSVNPADISVEERRVFRAIQLACEGAVEFNNALGLVHEDKLISTHQLAVLCGTHDSTIRNLWKERRVAPTTMSQSNALLWRVDNTLITAIKRFLAREGDLPPQQFSARKDIVHFHIEST